MTIQSRVIINGSDYGDNRNVNISQSIADNNASWFFNATIDNPYGRHKSDFVVGKEVKIIGGNGPIFNLQSQWSLSEGSGTIVHDEISNAVGSLIGSTTWVTSLPYLGSGISFTGTSGTYVELGSPSSLRSPTSQITILAWVKPSPAIILPNTIISTQNPTTAGAGSRTGYSLEYDMGIQRRINARLGFGDSVVVKQTNVTLNAGSWNQVGMTYNGSEIQIFANGAPVGTLVGLNIGSSIVYSGTQTTKIGTAEFANSRHFSGLIADVRIYDRAITTAEIAQNYNTGSATYDSNLFTGIIESVNFQGEGLSENVELRGRDYSARLMDNTVNTILFTNKEIGSIVKTVIADNLTDITTNNVRTTPVVLPRIQFNQEPIFDDVKQLAELAQSYFYVDKFKDLHLEPAGSFATNLIFNSGAILDMTFDRTREGMANKVFIYGDRYLSAAPRELFSVGSPTGSVYTLVYRPHNSQVQTSNTTPGSNLVGGILNMVSESSLSGIQYLVNFDDRQIVFVSGTTIGYSTIPNENGSVLVSYDRDTPIIKYGQNNSSINAFGPKTLVINDKSIKDPATAESLLNAELLKADPFNNIEMSLKGWYRFKPGQTVQVKMPDFGLNDTLPIIGIDYTFQPESNLSERVTKVRLDRKVLDLTDQIVDINKRLNSLEAEDRLEGDFLTRLEFGAGSMLILGSYWTVRTRYNGSEFGVWPSSNVPPLGSNFTPRLGLLNSGAGLGVGSMSYLVSGIFGTPLQILRSGGYLY